MKTDILQPPHPRPVTDQDRNRWLGVADKLAPELIHTKRLPVSIVTTVQDKNAFQGARMEFAEIYGTSFLRTLKAGDELIFDFGEHLVGYFRFSIAEHGVPIGFPVRLRFVFAEVPAETLTPIGRIEGGISSSWVQEEVITIDDVSAEIKMPRRYAFRYVKVLADGVCGEQVKMKDIWCDAVSAVSLDSVSAPGTHLDARMREIDRVSLRTLRDCMQTVFEDGPKRDRRLWLGDLRLEALLNYASYKNYDVVKRCLYLFAALPSDDDFLCACIYEQPARKGECRILDYAALFAPTLWEYAEASGDWKTAKELLPVATRQFINILGTMVNDDGLFIVPENWWLFIDWDSSLNRQASLQGVIIYCLRYYRKLLERLGDGTSCDAVDCCIQQMSEAANHYLWDASPGLFTSGTDREISWASQIWMTLSGVHEPEENRKTLERMIKLPCDHSPVSPYLHHYLIEAMLACGMHSQAFSHIRSYWGGMIDKGADTFWEVYDPGNDMLSPYGSCRLNSYCHAWSCTPGYYIRKYNKASSNGRTA